METSIATLVKETKQELLVLGKNPYAFIAPSAYDTAWLAMVPADAKPRQPMFKDCLTWVLNSQREEGFWGEYDGHGIPTVECLPATIACMIALKKWNVGETLIEKGLGFIEANAEKLLGEASNSYPRWFVIVFTGMMELASKNDLQITLPDQVKGVVADIFDARQRFLDKEELVEKYHYPPLLLYLEALPLHSINQEVIAKHLCEDGSLFQSPSATAAAFMATGNKDCLHYLQSLVRRSSSSSGIPPAYPMDAELTKLCVVNQLERLGLAEHFRAEIEEVLEQVYRNHINQEPGSELSTPIAFSRQLYKDSLAFRLLRMHGYNISPWHFCWFLNDRDMLECLEENHEYFSSVMLNVYRATDLMFPEEHELEEARSFSRKLLEKTISAVANKDHTISSPFPDFHNLIKRELKFPWISRMDHLEHRTWIEEKNLTALWMGKTSFHRRSSLHANKFKELAVKTYEFRQASYKAELEELTRWSRRWGLSDMGFGREKTVYCYFAIAASSSLPRDSEIRLIAAKSAIIITVADDFYDTEGSIDELTKLTDAVRRWDSDGLSEHGKKIFAALENFVNDTAGKCLQQQGIDIMDSLKEIWYGTFASWFVEAKWSRSRYVPSKEEYLETGMTSIATHTLLLPTSYFLDQTLHCHKFSSPTHLQTITRLLMIMPRLLNDTQSYEKEEEEGKTNFVSLHKKENPNADIEESVAYVRDILEKLKQQFLQHALMDGLSDVSKPCKELHMSCLKAFQMFFDSSNRYDSDTDLLLDIQKAFFVPVQVGAPEPAKPLKPLEPIKHFPHHSSGQPKRCQTIAHYRSYHRIKPSYSITLPPRSMISSPKPRNHPRMNMPVLPGFKFCYM